MAMDSTRLEQAHQSNITNLSEMYAAAGLNGEVAALYREIASELERDCKPCLRDNIPLLASAETERRLRRRYGAPQSE